MIKKANRIIKIYGGGIRMTVLAKPRNNAFFIDESKSKQFLQDSRKNAVTKDFLKQCQESANLFKKMDLSRKI